MTTAPDIEEARDAGTEAGQHDRRLLAALLAMTALLVPLLALRSGPGDIVGSLVLLFLPMALTIGLVYGRGSRRTFCIGAMFSAGAMLYSFATVGSEMPLRAPGPFSTSPSGQAGIAIVVVYDVAQTIVFGLLAIGIRRWVESRAAVSLQQPLEQSLGACPVARHADDMP